MSKEAPSDNYLTYCAFLWHHGESTAAQPPTADAPKGEKQ